MERDHPKSEPSPTNIFVLTPNHIGKVIVLDTRDENFPQIFTFKVKDVITEDIVKEQNQLISELISDNEGMGSIIERSNGLLFRKSMINIANKLNKEPVSFSMQAVAVEYLSTLKLSEVKEIFREAKRVGVLSKLIANIKKVKNEALVLGKETKSTIWENPTSNLHGPKN